MYSTGSYVQSLQLEHDGRQHEKEKNLHIGMTGSLCCATEVEHYQSTKL